MTFGEIKVGDVFDFQGQDIMIKTKPIKDGKDECFYTCVSLTTGNHYKIIDTEVITQLKKEAIPLYNKDEDKTTIRYSIIEKL